MTTPKTARTIILDFMENSLNDKLKGCFNADTLKARIDFALTELAELVSVKPQYLHEWYLEATKELHPESYNPKAQKPYEELTAEQKFIDKYIANKISALITTKLGVKDEGRVLPLQAGHI